MSERVERPLRIVMRVLDDRRHMVTIYDAATGEALLQGECKAFEFSAPPFRSPAWYTALLEGEACGVLPWELSE